MYTMDDERVSAQRSRHSVLFFLQAACLSPFSAVVIVLIHSAASFTIDDFNCLAVDPVLALLSTSLTGVGQPISSSSSQIVSNHSSAARHALAREAVAAAIDLNRAGGHRFFFTHCLDFLVLLTLIRSRPELAYWHWSACASIQIIKEEDLSTAELISPTSSRDETHYPCQPVYAVDSSGGRQRHPAFRRARPETD